MFGVIPWLHKMFLQACFLSQFFHLSVYVHTEKVQVDPASIKDYVNTWQFIIVTKQKCGDIQT